ncbi:Tetrahydrofolate dehydrogenase/cyclohydrolase [Syntrophomonas zehnderi OL-4]|uniref:Bifunctional protein FolD n=1 Tax=Syntrophomonas zehnderi OL-4 TaxID=690567 RepID=A0A0E4GDK6_9FIRM|nr:bifunctional 5,10-methylenetetrahydrofolate dehydrogenase/5,10-methenyltetrahydrofolate cyclohydrolase [Syntrophomonas zehnderi]CFX49599.1 Tetrahydrofolate dehydrogenase/cyclohydrolase [Syntrophomonas zehnderi OL-4]
MELICGKDISSEIRNQLKENLAQEGLKPCLAVINVGDDKENLLYIGLKENAVDTLGGETRIASLPQNAAKEEVLNLINELNHDQAVNGILLQLPLPKELQPYEQEFLSAIDPAKDVDGFHPVNMGRLVNGTPGFISCAALACMDISKRYKAPLAGKKVLLIGDSFDLIRPLALMFIKESCQVSVAPQYKSALMEGVDIAVIEAGGPHIVKASGIKEGALLIDAGFYYDQNSLFGNVDKEDLSKIDGHLLPVPGGVGPMLITKLLENLCMAAGMSLPDKNTG